MSFKVEATDGSGFASNALRFATQEEADAYGRDLFSRWTGCRDTRTVECDDPVNYVWSPAQMRAVPIDQHVQCRKCGRDFTLPRDQESWDEPCPVDGCAHVQG